MKIPTAPLSEVLIEAKPGFACGEDTANGVFQFRMNNVTTRGTLDLAKRRRVPPSKRRINDYLLCPGDVLFNATNSRENVGKSAYFPGVDEPAVFSNHFLRLRPNKEWLHGRYLAHWLNAQYQRGVFSALCRQWVNQATVGRESLLALEMPLPTVLEQRRVAEVLDRAEALRAQRRTAISLLTELETALFLAHFADVAEWPMSTIAEVACAKPGSIRTGPFGSQLLHSEFTEQGVAVLGIDNVVANEFRWGERRFISQTKYKQLQRYTVRPGDVLITIMGTCGRCAVVPEDVPLAINTKHLCCITLDGTKCRPAFVHAYFLRHPLARSYLEQRAKGAIMAGLNMGIISEMPIPVPPLELQVEFESRLARLRDQRELYLRSEVQLDSLFASLQHRAFRGEL